MVETMVGVVIGAVIAWVTSRNLQDRQFAHEAKLRNDLLKTQIHLLQADLQEAYDKLFVGDSSLYVQKPNEFFANYREFNISNKEAVWPEIVKSRIIIKHSDLFQKINNIFYGLNSLNEEFKICQPHQYDITADHVNFRKIKNWIDRIRRNYDHSATHSDNMSFEETSLNKKIREILEI